jgi:hypothetical protein
VGYLKILLPTSVSSKGEWFYVKNLASSAPCFTSRESVSMEDWNYEAEPGLKVEVEPFLVVLKMLKEQGLTGSRLVRVFMHHRVQPLMAHQRPMHKYSGVNDPDRHSTEPLALCKIEARVKVATTLPSGSFMHEDF